MKKHAIILGALTLVLFGGVTLVMAQVADPGPLTVCESGFSDPKLVGPAQRICDFQAFLELVGKVFKYLVWISVPLATLGIGIGGFMMIFGGASESQVTRGKEIFWDSIIGFVIVVAAFIIVKTILVGLGVDARYLSLFSG